MNIGNEIKRLRKKKGLSQSELAQVLNVTAQSISKWESNTSYPDISQLPAIASFFGITIDELFVYPTDLEYERIEQSIENGNPLTNEMFVHSENFLLEEIKRNPNNHRAVSMIGDLYLFEASCLNEKAAHYAMEALRMKPDNKSDLSVLINASGGYIVDWNVASHHKLIEQLIALIQNDSSHSERTKMFLLDNLIADGRLEEAEHILEENPNIRLCEIFKTMLVEKREGFSVAKPIYQKLSVEKQENWDILMEVANRFAFNAEYEEAIELYEKSHTLAPKPRYTDMLECIARLNQMLGNNEKAIDAYKRQLIVLKEEWNITKGEVIDSLKENIEQLS